MRKFINAVVDDKGRISEVLLEGNIRPTPMSTVKRMVAEDKIEGLELVRMRNGHTYVRAVADGIAENNLGELAEVSETPAGKVKTLWLTVAGVAKRIFGLA